MNNKLHKIGKILFARKVLLPRTVLLLIPALLIFLFASILPAEVEHHLLNDYNCLTCHYTNLFLGIKGGDCLNCHKPGDPYGYKKGFSQADFADPFNRFTTARLPQQFQTSHNWLANYNVVSAGALPPENPALTWDCDASIAKNEVYCTRCHNVHMSLQSEEDLAKMKPLLRMVNDRDQMCMDCHRPRNTTSHITGSHPVGVPYGGAGSLVSIKPDQFRNPPVNSNPANPTSAMKIKSGQVLCTTCHGIHATDSNSATFDSFTSVLTPSAGYLLRTDLKGSSATALNICTNCHIKPNHNQKNQNIQCSDCHAGHVDTADGSLPNVYLIRRFMNISTRIGKVVGSPAFYQYTGSSRNWNSSDPAKPGVCQACHRVPTEGYPTEHAVKDNAGVCMRCHSHANTFSHGAGGSGTGCGTATSCHGTSQPHKTHVSGEIQSLQCSECHDVNSYPRFMDGLGLSETMVCKNCHSANGEELARMWGSGACLSCHAVAVGNRAAITSQFGAGSHHVQGAVTNAHCYQCHWESNSDGTINQRYHSGSAASGAPVDLVIYGAGIRQENYSTGVSAVRYTANGTRSEIEKINNHCLGCHSDQNNATQPFGDGRTPREYAWDGTSVAARYAQTGATVWGKYTTGNVAAKKITKTFSAHGNLAGNQRGWNTSTGVDGVISNSGGTVNVQCYDCHNSHGSRASGITSRYSSATGKNRGGILKTTLAGQGGYAVAYQPYTSGSLTTRNKRNPGANLCLDCHLSQNAETTPWGYGSTFGAIQAVAGYFDLFRYRGYSTAGAHQRYGFKKKNEVMGGHFGASSPLSATPASGIDGLCTPCHDPHGVSPTLGDKQHFAVPLLKGTWLTSPYLEDVAPNSNARLTKRTEVGGEGVKYHIDQNTFASDLRSGQLTNLPFNNVSTSAGLCVGCHPKSSLTDGATHDWKNKNRIHESVQGWKTTGSTAKHSYTCSKCHSPHTNSVLPRLMVTNCLDSRHKGQVTWAPAITSGSGWGQYVINTKPSLRKCSEIPYSYRRWGYADLAGGWGWCGTGYYPRGTGSGSGRIPGSWSGDTLWYESHPVACHENNTGSGTDQSWNTVTPWSEYPEIAINAGPVAGTDGLQPTVAWSTNVPGTSTVDYGLTAAYSLTVSGGTGVLDHAVKLPIALNHSAYHYQVTTVATDGQRISSGDRTAAYLSLPPTVPVPLSAPGKYCASGCVQTLKWNASTDPDGGPVQYQVQVSSAADFGSIVFDSGWISATTATTAPAAGNATYWWRVRARDGNHTTLDDPASSWSAVGSYVFSETLPAAPIGLAAIPISSTSIGWSFSDVANNEDGFRLHDSSHAIKGVAAVPDTSSILETGLTPNTGYTRHIHAYNAGGESLPSSDRNVYTLSPPPAFVASAGQAGVSFTTSTPFGAGGVMYYRYVWDNSPAHTFNQSEQVLSVNSLALTTSGTNPWYLHVEAYNSSAYSTGQPQHLGPFFYDLTPPAVTSFSATTPWSENFAVPITSFAATDNNVLTGYMITTSSTPPSASDGRWSATVPAV